MIQYKNILAWAWFHSAGGEIGIVLTYDPITKKLKSYIGAYRPTQEAEDALTIANLGGSFVVEAAIEVIKLKGILNAHAENIEVLKDHFNLT